MVSNAKKGGCFIPVAKDFDFSYNRPAIMIPQCRDNLR